MPIRRVDSMRSIEVHKRQRSMLFKKAEEIREECYDTGDKMLKNVRFNAITKFLFVALDKFNSKLANHKKISKFAVALCEKIIKNTNNI